MNFFKCFLTVILLASLSLPVSADTKAQPEQKKSDNQKKNEQPSSSEFDPFTQDYRNTVIGASAKWVHDEATVDFLCKNAPQEIKDFIAMSQTIVNFPEEIGSPSLIKKIIPSRLLLIGPPGVGKSTLAGIIGIKLKRRCILLRLPMLATEYRNSETSGLNRFVSQILSEKIPTVLVFDEINVFAQKKNGPGNDAFTAANLWLLLDKCAADPNILIIGTCNSAEELAPQLKDRFEGNVIEINSADVEDRFEIISYYLSNLRNGCTEKYLRSLAKKTEDFSPRQLEALIYSACQRSILRACIFVITDEDLEASYLKFVKSSGIMKSRPSRIDSLKKWFGDNCPFITSVAATVNLGLLGVSLLYVMIKGDPGHLMKPYKV